MQVRDAMTRVVLTTRSEESVLEAARCMRDEGVGFLPVLDAGRVVGVLTDRDITVRTVAEGAVPRSTPVRDVMSSEVVTIGEASSVEDAEELMEARTVRRLVVLDARGALVGVLALDDLAVVVRRELRSGEDPSARAGDVMSRSLLAVAASARPVAAARGSRERGLHHLVVVRAELLPESTGAHRLACPIESGDVLGIVCGHDLEVAPPTGTVGEVMSRPVVMVPHDTPLPEIVRIIRTTAIGCVLVTKGGRVEGIVTRSDLRRAEVPDALLVPEVCASCGGRHQVRPEPRCGGVGFCASCREQIEARCDEREMGAGD